MNSVNVIHNSVNYQCNDTCCADKIHSKPTIWDYNNPEWYSEEEKQIVDNAIIQHKLIQESTFVDTKNNNY